MPTQHAGLVLSAHAQNIYYELVKVVNNASGIIMLAAQAGMQSSIESEHKIPISSLAGAAERESQWFFG